MAGTGFKSANRSTGGTDPRPQPLNRNASAKQSSGARSYMGGAQQVSPKAGLTDRRATAPGVSGNASQFTGRVPAAPRDSRPINGTDPRPTDNQPSSKPLNPTEQGLENSLKGPSATDADRPAKTAPEAPKESPAKEPFVQRPRTTEELDKLFNKPGEKPETKPDTKAGNKPPAQPAAEQKPVGKLKAAGQYVGKHKKKFGAGGGIVGTLVAMTFGYLALLPLKILHIEANLFHHNHSVEESVEKKIASRLLRSTMSPYDDQGRYKITGRGFFGNKWGKFRLDRFEARLAQKGIVLKTDGKGKLISIQNGGTIEDVSKLGQVEKLLKLSSIVNDNVPIWRIGKRIKFIRLMTIRYGVSFKFWTGEQIKSFGDFLKARAKEVREGATSDEIDAAKAARDQANVDPNNPNGPPKNAGSTAAGDEASQAVQDEFAKSSDMKAAIKAGASKLKGSKALGITGIVVLICGLQDMANKAIAHGYDQRAEELMRVGGNLLSAAAQQRKGDKDYSSGINFFMQQLAPDPNAKPVQVGEKTVTPESGLDFTAAADWKRAAGEPVNSSNPELAGGANPDGKTGIASVMSVINAITGFGGVGDAICAVALSPVGIIVGGVELVANIIDGGAEEAIATTAKIALQVYLMVKVVPDLLSAAAGLAITGTEDAVQQLAMSNAGIGLMAADYSRSIGMLPVSDATYAAAATQVDQQERIAASHQSLAYNLLSTDNPRSVLSKLIDASPSTPQQGFAALLTHAFNFTATLRTGFLAAITPAHAADDTASNPNKFQRYLLADDAINKYDPADIIKYFEGPVALSNGEEVSRIDAMGDPDTFQFGNQDPNSNNALHCFVNAFRNPFESKQGDDPVCQNIGYLTQSDGVTAVSDQAYADGIQKNVYDPWCQSANVDKCPQAAPDEMTRYALYLQYQHAGDELFNLQYNDAETKAAGDALNSPYTGAVGNGGPTTATPTGDVQALAKQMLSMPSITYWTNNGVNTRDVVQALADGKPAYTTCANANNATPDINPNILKFIIEAGGATHIMVNALTDKCHTNGSHHYTGEAVDIDLTSGPFSILNPIAQKYGGTRNTETSHYHFDFPK